MDSKILKVFLWFFGFAMFVALVFVIGFLGYIAVDLAPESTDVMNRVRFSIVGVAIFALFMHLWVFHTVAKHGE